MSPSRDTPAGRAYLDLQRAARSGGRPVDELMQLYVLEGFLDRLARSEARDLFVLKGGVLLAAFDARRPTRDVDLQGQDLSNDADEVLSRMVQIAGQPVDDGLVFDTGSASAAVIRDEDEYRGVRVTMTAGLATARLTFHVDVSVGDPITPAPSEIDLPRLLGGTIRVRGYPLALVHAEKIVTALARGTVNTRWRDFVDVVSLARLHPVDGTELVTSVEEVARHRAIELRSLATVLDGYAEIGQRRWTAWRRRQQLEDRTRENFGDLLAAFVAFADPAVLGLARAQRWDPAAFVWT